jgi:DNA-binding NarL/FixJ family response regulator
MDKYKILIADDQSIIRDGLKLILEMEEDLEVVGLASNGSEAYELSAKLQPDLVLMDIRMPKCDGVLGTKMICDEFPSTKVIILTSFLDDNYIFEALRNGAKGYLLKDVESDELANSIRAVIRGGVLIHPEVAAKMVMGLNSDSNKPKPEPQKNFQSLTPREIEITRLIGLGKANREIAKELFLSEGTVKNHITNILSKLLLRDRTQIALFASQNDLI